MYVMRRWATRNARALEGVYDACARVFHALDPLWAGIGLKRLERPMAAIERWGKGLVFDCRMCGRCVLSSTGMTCPENCPKGLRNGPCGGVRANGTCEVKPAMRCVWVEAWSGAVRMRDHRAMLALQPPRNHAIAGTSAWLRLSAERLARRDGAARQQATPP